MKAIALGLVFLCGAAAAADYPPPVRALIEQGVHIEAQFETPAGMTGYAARVDGQPLAFYLTSDGKHLIVGHMLDTQGHNLTQGQLTQYLPKPDFEAAWPELAKASWVREGDPAAERIVYVFTDPNCPYCNAFWKATQPHLGKQLQVRHILVAILGPSSEGKAARILAAKDPGAALAENETRHREGGIAPLESIPPEIRGRIAANNQLMSSLGASATPAIFYRDGEAKVRRVIGLPQPESLAGEILQKR